MTRFFNKWLPIIFGCHCRDDRSFHYKGKKFPICARCTGELIGILIGLFAFAVYSISWKAALLIMLPLIFDGFLQQLTKYESNNIKRLITGVLFGLALSDLFWVTTKAAFNYGVQLALKLNI